SISAMKISFRGTAQFRVGRNDGAVSWQRCGAAMHTVRLWPCMALLFKLDHPAFGAVHRGDACSRLSPLAACAVCGFSDLVLPAPFMPWRFSLAVRGPSQAVVGVHAALENFRIGGSIKEARSDTQRTNLIARSPRGADLIGLPVHLPASSMSRRSKPK